MHNQSSQLGYKIRDAIRITSLSRATIYRLINKGQLETVKIGCRNVIKGDSLHKLMQIDGGAWNSTKAA